MTLDLADLKKRALGRESVGIPNAMLLELVELAGMGARLGDLLLRGALDFARLVHEVDVRVERVAGDPQRIDITVNAAALAMPDQVTVRFDREAPFVCPGCYAVGGEPCAPYCIDAEIEADHRHAIESGDYERFDEDDDPEDEISCLLCGRVACSCEQSAEGADEVANA